MSEGRVVYHCEVHAKVIEGYERETASLRAEVAALRDALERARADVRTLQGALGQQVQITVDTDKRAAEGWAKYDEACALLARAADIRAPGPWKKLLDFQADARAFLDAAAKAVFSAGPPVPTFSHDFLDPRRDDVGGLIATVEEATGAPVRAVYGARDDAGRSNAEVVKRMEELNVPRNLGVVPARDEARRCEHEWWREPLDAGGWFVACRKCGKLSDTHMGPARDEARRCTCHFGLHNEGLATVTPTPTQHAANCPARDEARVKGGAP